MGKIVFDQWQLDFLECKGDKICSTGRQIGKSEVAAEDCGRYARNNENKVIVMIAPTERQAEGLFQKTLSWLTENAPRLIKKGKDKPTLSKIPLYNGTIIYCLPVGKSGLSVRFLTIDRLYVDEASRVPPEVFVAVDPCLASTGGDTIYLSTFDGDQGRFYECWTNKDGAYDSFTRFSATTEEIYQNRPISEVWTIERRAKALQYLERQKRRLSAKMYAQEYLAVVAIGYSRYFSDKLIYDCCVLKRPHEIQKGQKYYLGVDIARLGEDESTFEVLLRVNRELFIQVESIVTVKTDTTQTQDKIQALDDIYNFKAIWIDAGSGSLGVGVLDNLQRKYKCGSKVEAVDNKERQLDKYGKKTRKMLKEDLYDNLRAMMEQGRVKLLDDEEIIESLQSVKYEYLHEEGETTKIKITGTYTHITEGLIRAAVAGMDKRLDLWAGSYSFGAR